MSSNGDDKLDLSMNPKVEQHRRMIVEARKKGKLPLLGVFVRLSGPGWLQSAITLGGGSLSSAMYLGVLVGFSFMWLQPLAMILGVIMLSAIGFVTLSTGERPFGAINKHVSPILGWGWLLASMMANLVWSMPQFSLGIAAVQQNLLPGTFGVEAMPDPWGKVVVGCLFLAVAITFVMFYNVGGRGVKLFEIIVKVMVGSIVLCFFGVVIKMTAEGVLDWGAIGRGMIPDLGLLMRPAEAFRPHIEAVSESCRSFWNDLIVGQQRDVMISAAATAVGINMTFLLPYSMLRKGWDKEFRGLAIFDLSTGLFFPFIVATGCVVIASASQFHAVAAPGFLGEKDDKGQLVQPADNLAGPYKALMLQRIRFGMLADPAAYFKDGLSSEEFKALSPDFKGGLSAEEREKLFPDFEDGLSPEELAELSPEDVTRLVDARFQALEKLPSKEKNPRVDEMIQAMPVEDRRLAAMLVKRDAFNLADSLAPLTGKTIAKYLFGLGVLGMAMGAATMLMLINGLCLCEMLNRPAKGWTQRIGSLMVSVGVLGPFFWKDAKMWLAVPTSVFAMVLLPIAYFAFYSLLNQKKLLGDNMPRGARRVVWNVLMAIAAGLAAFASVWSLWSKLQWIGMGLIVVFIGLILIVRKGRTAEG